MFTKAFEVREVIIVIPSGTRGISCH